MSKLANKLKSMRRPRHYDRESILLIMIVFSFFAFLIFSFTSKTIHYRFNYKDHVLQLQELYNGKKTSNVKDEGDIARRYLRGRLGSIPPRCASKCGNCTPCKPVHVPVPPGTPVTAEYYPEAWRCKCGNRLYMP